MSLFKYIDSVKRTYPHIIHDAGVLVAEAGKIYELANDPADGRWEIQVAEKIAKSVSKSPETAPEAVSEPAIAEADPSTTKESE